MLSSSFSDRFELLVTIHLYGDPVLAPFGIWSIVELTSFAVLIKYALILRGLGSYYLAAMLNGVGIFHAVVHCALKVWIIT